MTSSPFDGEEPGRRPARAPASRSRPAARRSAVPDPHRLPAARVPALASAAAEPAAPSAPAGVLAGARPQPIVPRSMGEALELARAVVAAGLAPRGLERAEACMIAILHGLEVGLTPMAALQRIAVIDGRPTIWGDGALALVRASGLLVSIREVIEGDRDEAWTALCSVERRGEPQPLTRSFSVHEARRAGLWQKPGPWRDYPRRMLQMRARAFALRDAFADVLGGLYLREEIEEPLRAPPPPPFSPPAPPEAEPWAGRSGGAEAPSTGLNPEPAGGIVEAGQALAPAGPPSPAPVRPRAKGDTPSEDESTEPAAQAVSATQAKKLRARTRSMARRIPRHERRAAATRRNGSWRRLGDVARGVTSRLPRTEHTPSSETQEPPSPAVDQASSAAGSDPAAGRDDPAPPTRPGRRREAREETQPWSPPRALLADYDLALCCARDEETLVEIEGEFEAQLDALRPQEREQAAFILARHRARVRRLAGEGPA